MLFWHISSKTVPLCVSLQECFIFKGEKKGVGLGESIDIVASMT